MGGGLVPETGSAVLRELDTAGYQLRVVDEQLRFKPLDMPDDLLAKVKRNREELVKLVRLRQRHVSEGSKLTAFRQLVPAFWEVFRVPDGRCGLLWGINPRGAMLDIGGFLYSFDPEEIEPVGRE